MDLELLHERARIIREVRGFFDSRQYLSVDTPLMAPDLIPESCLEVFETAWIPPGFTANGLKQSAEKRWLIPSPEIWMKQLISRHWENMYQICKCFRNTESRGNLHNPEFTMLEYYTMNADYMDSLQITEELFVCLLNSMNGPAAFRPPFFRITVEEAFRRWAGFSLSETAGAGQAAMEREARRLGLEPALDKMEESAAIAVLYDLIFIHAVEPSLPKDKPVVLMDYPAFVPCLAKHDGHVKERWELYLSGIELANCYSEETDPDELRRFFEQEAVKKERHALVKHRIDRNCWKKFTSRGHPTTAEPTAAYSGVALGLDRLIMALLEKRSIETVLPFIV